MATKKHENAYNETIVPQLDKCLEFKSIREGGDKSDYILYKITP